MRLTRLAFKRLDREPYDTKAAVREIFEAVEILAKLVTKTNDDLAERMVLKRIKPICRACVRVYGRLCAILR